MNSSTCLVKEKLYFRELLSIPFLSIGVKYVCKVKRRSRNARKCGFFFDTHLNSKTVSVPLAFYLQTLFSKRENNLYYWSSMCLTTMQSYQRPFHIAGQISLRIWMRLIWEACFRRIAQNMCCASKWSATKRLRGLFPSKKPWERLENNYYV